IIKGIEHVIPDFCFFKLDLWFYEPVQSSVADYCGRRGQIDDGPPFVTLQRTGKLKIFLLALKYSRSPEILNVLRQIIRISEEAQKIEKWKYDYLNVVLNYLSSVIEESLYEQFWRIVVKELSCGVEYMGTIADKMRREAREKIERELRKEFEKKDSELEKKDSELKKIDSELKKIDSELEKIDSELEKKETELEKENDLLHQIVRRMHKKGISLKSIQEITGFDNETIEKIIKSADV
ncbi:MAG: hypothetical protein GX625_11305, partial [Clostridiaceae bacterium]|nr:hypothetical protein [Clostridiaceae bacterium]